MRWMMRWMMEWMMIWMMKWIMKWMLKRMMTMLTGYSMHASHFLSQHLGMIGSFWTTPFANILPIHTLDPSPSLVSTLHPFNPPIFFFRWFHSNVSSHLFPFGRKTPADFIAAVNAVTVKDIMEVSKKILKTPLSLAAYGDGEHAASHWEQTWEESWEESWERNGVQSSWLRQFLIASKWIDESRCIVCTGLLLVCSQLIIGPTVRIGSTVRTGSTAMPAMFSLIFLNYSFQLGSILLLLVWWQTW